MISIVTPTLHRPDQVAALLDNLAHQTLESFEIILIDGAPDDDHQTEQIVQGRIDQLPYSCVYLRGSGGTAIQRNIGLDAARGDYIGFIDDDIRLEPDFLELLKSVFDTDTQVKVGGVAGYITNQHLDPETSPRWQWYRRLKLFTTYEPGRYDYETGYPINRYLQPPHNTLREIDFMGSNCALWRREVFDQGLRFAEFFVGYGVLEDAHLALRARQHWQLLEYGKARCIHLHSPAGRENALLIARKSATNYRYVFINIVPHRSLRQEYRFWRVQLFDLVRFLLYALRHPSRKSWLTVWGKILGIGAAAFLKPDQGA